jgi:hypothetical protein
MHFYDLEEDFYKKNFLIEFLLDKNEKFNQTIKIHKEKFPQFCHIFQE